MAKPRNPALPHPTGKTPIRILIVTPTRNRLPQLTVQIKQFRQEAIKRKFLVEHIIINDGSSEYKTEYYQLREKFHEGKFYRIWYFRYKTAHGRDRYWKLWNDALTWIKERAWDYCIVMADDLQPCANFLCNATNLMYFHRRQSHRYCAANLFARFPTNWGTTEYVDGCFIATRAFFDTLHWALEPIEKFRFRSSPHRSSGVWQQVTNRFKKKRARIAPVGPISYVKSLDCVSQMFHYIDFPRRGASSQWINCFLDDVCNGDAYEVENLARKANKAKNLAMQGLSAREKEILSEQAK